MKNRFAIIMAGGSGTRFWPKSSKKNPKQFLSLVDKKSMLSLTTDRLKGVVPPSNISVVSTKDLTVPIKKHLGKTKVIIEPEARNTMAAICLSVWQVAQKNPNAVLCILPADAHISSTKMYQQALHSALEFAESNPYIVCLGIKPTHPATGYGYIEVGPLLKSEAYTIQHFFEKPTIDKAEKFFSSGKFLWNAGIFIFKAQTFIDEVKMHAPDFFVAFESVFKKKANLFKIYSKLPKVPVDTALMEKTSRGALMVGDFGWNDVGSWPALAEVLKSNSEAGLVVGGSGFESVDSSNIVAWLDSKKFLGLVGVRDLIIVETKDALLVCSKDKAQEIKSLVGKLEKNPKFKKLI